MPSSDRKKMSKGWKSVILPDDFNDSLYKKHNSLFVCLAFLTAWQPYSILLTQNLSFLKTRAWAIYVPYKKNSFGSHTASLTHYSVNCNCHGCKGALCFKWSDTVSFFWWEAYQSLPVHVKNHSPPFPRSSFERWVFVIQMIHLSITNCSIKQIWTYKKTDMINSFTTREFSGLLS